jgi:branched-subunit amino acid aminotransferase/4-amino-4-deoxychorismate lyase
MRRCSSPAGGRAPGGGLYTPPDDGRILPGVTACLAGARPRTLALADLVHAAAVYVASALRGLSPAARMPAA